MVAIPTLIGMKVAAFPNFEITEIVILLVTVGVIVYTHNCDWNYSRCSFKWSSLSFFKRTKKLLALATFFPNISSTLLFYFLNERIFAIHIYQCYRGVLGPIAF